MTYIPNRAAKISLFEVDPRTRRRNAAEKRFRAYGAAAIAIAVIALVVLVGSIIRDGSGAFRQTYLSMPVALNAEKLDPKGNRDPAEMSKVLTLAYGRVLDDALNAAVHAAPRADSVQQADRLRSALSEG